ncbi:MAG: PQQ-binding-like beta-propeller repeat protein, partial [Pseudomonadota bacterium]
MCNKLKPVLILILILIVYFAGSPLMAKSGADIYAQTCAACHDSGADRTPTKADLKSMSPQAILTALETGPMRVIGIFSLTGPDRIAVAEHLSGQTYDANWKGDVANQCAPAAWPSAEPFAKPHWNGWGPGTRNARYQPANMANLDAKDVGNLELQWAFAFPGETVVESHASVVDGRLFIGSRGAAVYSLDAKSGCAYWRFDTEASVKTAIKISDVPIKGRYLAFFGDIGGAIYAVDAANGELVWKIYADSHPAARTIGAFQLHDGKLYIPVSSLEEGLAADPNYECCSFRASVMRVDAMTGVVEWRKYLVEEPAQMTGKNANGRAMWGPSGAAVWSSPTLDPKRNVLYVSTGDNYSHPESK